MNVHDANIGDSVGFVDGPGIFPQDNMGKIVRKVEDRWGKHVEVEMEDGEIKTVSSHFANVGIGAHYLGS